MPKPREYSPKPRVTFLFVVGLANKQMGEKCGWKKEWKEA